MEQPNEPIVSAQADSDAPIEQRPYHHEPMLTDDVRQWAQDMLRQQAKAQADQPNEQPAARQ
jgi:hypothetical protein